MAVPEEQMTDSIGRRVMSGKQRTRNAEHEIHAGVLACIRARRQMLERIADKQADRALVLRCDIFHNVHYRSCWRFGGTPTSAATSALRHLVA